MFFICGLELQYHDSLEIYELFLDHIKGIAGQKNVQKLQFCKYRFSGGNSFIASKSESSYTKDDADPEDQNEHLAFLDANS